MKIAILYICTGNYDVFWDGFYESAEKNFYPNFEKEYFIFSDSKKMYALASEKIHVFWQNNAGWPYNTLMRYQWFCSVQDALSSFDYAFFCNANMRFLKPTTEKEIPLPTEDAPLTLAVHTQNYEDELGINFQPERNPKSRAYIPEGTPVRAYAGGFWGGTAKAVMEMCRTLRDRINDDLSRDIIAIWHDQSHLQKYASEKAHSIIAKNVISSEEYSNDESYAIFLNKAHFGGNDKLRGVPAKKRFFNKVKHFPRRVARALGITRLFKKLLRRK